MEPKLIGYDPEYKEHKRMYELMSNLIDNVFRVPRHAVGFSEVVYG